MITIVQYIHTYAFKILNQSAALKNLKFIIMQQGYCSKKSYRKFQFCRHNKLRCTTTEDIHAVSNAFLKHADINTMNKSTATEMSLKIQSQ